MFQNLESVNELEQCRQYEARYLAVEEATAQKLWSIGQSYFNNIEDSKFDESLDDVRKIVEQYTVDVIAFNGDGYDGRNCSLMGTDAGERYNWNIIGSLLFAITIYTTVGYGNIAPKTDWGRITVVVYAMIGIPIMLVCVAMIGEVMADVLRFVYIQLCCCGFCARRSRRRRQREAAERRRRESETQRANQQTNPPSWTQLYQEQMSINRNQQPPVVIDDYDDLLDDQDPTVGIPLTVTLLVIAGYIVMGAAIFGVWEGWEPMDAAYFCFVTISTIGFGDFVPGAAAGVVNSGDTVRIVVGGIYIVLGLAIIAMAFNLIQENIVKKVKMLEDKLTGSTPEGHDAMGSVGSVPTAVVHPAAIASDPASIPHGTGKQQRKADHPQASRPNDDNETSFSNSGPPTSSSHHGARPKTPKAADDTDRPDSHRPSLDLPSIAE